MTFFQLVERRGMPSRIRRFCCEVLKEYKILDKAIIGVRRDESVNRAKRYKEPTQCRVYSKTKKVEQIMPLLDWTTKDVAEFIKDRGITCAPHYYVNGRFDADRRLGCLACPLTSVKGRVEEFKQFPNLVKAYIRAIRIYRANHPDHVAVTRYADEYEYFCRNVFYDREYDFIEAKTGMFLQDVNYKNFLEDYFNIRL